MKLLQFKAIWCSSCKIQTIEFEENPIDIEIETIDVDQDDNDLVTQYTVKSLPTIILIGDNNEVLHRWTGFTKSSTINEFIYNLYTTKEKS